jgi:16S rRNA (uracil1498-N3)-methyltransferase
MRTPRILCEELSSPSIQYTNIKQIHHLAKVLRVKPGDLVQLFDGKGNVAAAKINELSKQSIHFLIDEVYAEKNPYRMNYQAIFPYIKKDNLIFLIQKLTEIGINSLVIFKPDHIDQSLVKKDMGKLNEKIEEAIIHACEQSGCNFMPTVKYFKGLDDALEHATTGTESEDIFVLDTIADKLSGDLLKSNAKMISFITGPESGFSNNERALMAQKKISNYRLGHYILRAETAPLVTLSKLHILNGENA